MGTALPGAVINPIINLPGYLVGYYGAQAGGGDGWSGCGGFHPMDGEMYGVKGYWDSDANFCANNGTLIEGPATSEPELVDTICKMPADHPCMWRDHSKPRPFEDVINHPAIAFNVPTTESGGDSAA